MTGKTFEGSVAVSGDGTVGGNATVRGNAQVGHNLIVEGWLEARNIKDINKGLFVSPERLREVYPSPQEGWMALVGTSLPADVYVGEGGDWRKTGGKGGNPSFDMEKLDRSVQAVWMSDGEDELENAQPHLYVRFNNGEVKVDGILMAGDANGGMLRKAHYRRFSEAALKVEGLSSRTGMLEEKGTVLEKRISVAAEAAQSAKSDVARALTYTWIENGSEENEQLTLCFRTGDGSVVRQGIPMANASNTTAGMLSYRHWQEFRVAVSDVVKLRNEMQELERNISRVSSGIDALTGNKAQQTLDNYRAICEIMSDASSKEAFMYSLSQYTKRIDDLYTEVTSVKNILDEFSLQFQRESADLESEMGNILGKFTDTYDELIASRKEQIALRDEAAALRTDLSDRMEQLSISMQQQAATADVYFKKVDGLAAETASQIETAKSEVAALAQNTLERSEANVTIVQNKLSAHNATIDELQTQLNGTRDALEERLDALEAIHATGLTDTEVEEMLNQ